MKTISQSLFWLLLLGLNNCVPKTEQAAMAELIGQAPAIEGKTEYLESPYVTAGNRLYMVGHQDGSFPEIGWHIKGEMGGIWNHPIKLMDGFDTRLYLDGDTLALDNAIGFVNYPFANKHVYQPGSYQLQVERWQFVPDNTEGIAIQFRFMNTGENVMELEFEVRGHSDLRSTWLGEESGMTDGQDLAEYLGDTAAWMIRDEGNPWFVIFGADLPPISQSETENPYAGQGVSRGLSYSLSIPPQQTRLINIAVAGSYNSKEAALATYGKIQTGWPEAFKSKKSRYEQLAQQSELSVPDKQLQQTFEWLKYNCDWLNRTVPEIGSGITAGIPDYPWWFGVDSEYALKGYMAVGQTEAVYNTISLLDSVSLAVNGNGRILHEMSTNGVVFNEGNINETPQFASLIWEIYRWNGDKDFLKRYFPTVKMGLQWLMDENDGNKNLFPDGFGMMEIHGLDSEMIDVAAYTQRAFADAAKMAGELNEQELEREYRDTADKLKLKINAEFWSPAFGSYADFLGTDEQALGLIENAIIRADTLDKPWAVSELKQTAETIRRNPSSELRPFVVHHNWVVNTPMEMKIADSTKAIIALETAQKFVNPFGVFVTGIDRDESAGADEGSFRGSKIFSYTGAVMTLPTGVQAVAENNYGRPDEALKYLQRMSRSFSYALPGSMYEVSPDYGMITQAWNIYSFAIPIVQQFFGIQPQAYEKKVVIRPRMPAAWDQASIKNVLIADNKVSVFYERKEGHCSIRVEQSNPGWKLQLQLPVKEGRIYEVREGEATTARQIRGETSFSTLGTEIRVQWNE